MDDRVRACVAQLALMSPLAPCATGVRARGASRGPPFVQDLRVDGSVAGVGGELPEQFWLRCCLWRRPAPLPPSPLPSSPHTHIPPSAFGEKPVWEM